MSQIGNHHHASMMGLNPQNMLQSITQSLAQVATGGAFNAGFAAGLGAGMGLQGLAQLAGILPGADMMANMQMMLGRQSNLAGICGGGCHVPQPSLELSGAPAGQGLQKNPAGWPEGAVRTAGGYTVVPEGNTSWKVFGPDQKPGDKPVTHVSGDPHVDQKDGTRWDFTKNSDFLLPDGTRINCKTSSEKGYSVSTGLEITNGADHVSVGGLDGKATTGEVGHDGYEWRAQHMAENPGRDTFRLGGDGDDWFLERNGKNEGKITGAHMDATTGAYEQSTDGKSYSIDPNLRPPFGSEAWGNTLRGEALDFISGRLGLDPATAGDIGQMFHAEHSSSQYFQGLEKLSAFAGPFGGMNMLFNGPGEMFNALSSMGDAMNSLQSLNQDMMFRRAGMFAV